MRAGTGRQVNVNHRRAGPVRAQSRVLCLSDNLDDEVLDLRTACRRDRSPSRGRHARVVVGPDPTRGLVARGHATDVEPFVLLGELFRTPSTVRCTGAWHPVLRRVPCVLCDREAWTSCLERVGGRSRARGMAVLFQWWKARVTWSRFAWSLESCSAASCFAKRRKPTEHGLGKIGVGCHSCCQKGQRSPLEHF